MNDNEIQNRLEDLGFIIRGGIKRNRYVNCAHESYPPKKNAVWYKVSDKYVSYASWNSCLESGFFWLNEREYVAMDKAERERINQQRSEEQRKLALEDRQQRLAAVNKAYGNFRQIKRNHAYLTRKGIDFRADFTFDWSKRLVIPMLDITGILCGYQYIDDVGTKKFKTGSILKGSFYPFLVPGQKLANVEHIFLCEGVSTAGSVFQSLSADYANFAVLACFASNNVDLIYTVLKEQGHKNIISIQDYDPAGVKVQAPGFMIGFSYGQDANDVCCEFGSEALRRIIKFRMQALNLS